MDARWLLLAVAAAGVVGATPAIAGNGPDELWEVTVKMDMTGMPMSMPAQTTQVCVPKGRQEHTAPMDESCKVHDVKHSGNKTSYKFNCSGDMAMSGEGEATYSGDSYKGSMHAKGKTDGESFEMKQSYSGKRLGNCTYVDPGIKVKKMQAEQQENMDKACDPRTNRYTWRLYEKNAACGAYHDKFCTDVKSTAKSMRDPEKFTAFVRSQENWGETMKYCGVDAVKVQADVCVQAKAKRNWHFVANYCENEARTVAAKECAGRDYTSASTSEFAPICFKYAKENVEQKASKKLRKEPKPEKAAEAAEDAAGGAGQELLKKGLKGVFGF